MRRRDFITLIGTAAAAWPLAAHAQQTEKPLIGFLDGRLPDALANRLRGFHRGLREAGYVEGENVTVLYRYAENQIDRLPALADELTRRPVTVIVASGGPNVISAAKKATATIPIVFLTGEDPARLGLVASLARPGGNLTGINFFNRELVGKQLGFLRELVLSANRIAVLVNPANPGSPRQHQPRDRCGFRRIQARPPRCPICCRRPLLQQPTSSAIASCHAPRDTSDLFGPRVC